MQFNVLTHGDRRTGKSTEFFNETPKYNSKKDNSVTAAAAAVAAY